MVVPVVLVVVSVLFLPSRQQPYISHPVHHNLPICLFIFHPPSHLLPSNLKVTLAKPPNHVQQHSNVTAMSQHSNTARNATQQANAKGMQENALPNPRLGRELRAYSLTAILTWGKLQLSSQYTRKASSSQTHRSRPLVRLGASHPCAILVAQSTSSLLSMPRAYPGSLRPFLQ